MIQTAVAMAILMLVMSFGVEGLMKYQANSMPYSISAKVSAAVDSVQSATSSYIAQNSACMQNGLTGAGCNLSVSNLSPAYLPAFSGISGVNGSIFQTPDGSKIAVTPTGQSTYTISVAPSGVLSSNANALKYLASSFPGGSVASGAVSIPETTPSIANMLKANTPAWGTLAPDNSGKTQTTNCGSLNTWNGTQLSGCGQIYSGSINTNGQPITNYKAAIPNYVWTNNWGWQPVGASMTGGSIHLYGSSYESCTSNYPCLVLSPGVCRLYFDEIGFC